MTTEQATERDEWGSDWVHRGRIPRPRRIYEPPPPPLRRRVFWSLYAAAQVAFVAWIIYVYVTGSHSSRDCISVLGSRTCHGVTHAARDTAMAIIVAIWVAFDVIVGSTYTVYRLATDRA